METFSALLAQWRGTLMFSFICAWINSWVNNREAGDLRRHHAHYDVIVMEDPLIEVTKSPFFVFSVMDISDIAKWRDFFQVTFTFDRCHADEPRYYEVYFFSILLADDLPSLCSSIYEHSHRQVWVPFVYKASNFIVKTHMGRYIRQICITDIFHTFTFFLCRNFKILKYLIFALSYFCVFSVCLFIFYFFVYLFVCLLRGPFLV